MKIYVGIDIAKLNHEQIYVSSYACAPETAAILQVI